MILMVINLSLGKPLTNIICALARYLRIFQLYIRQFNLESILLFIKKR